MLKALFDSGAQILPNANRNTLFFLLCIIQYAEPIFPPAKRCRATPRGQLASYSAIATPTPGPSVELTSAAPSNRVSHSRNTRYQQSNASDSDFNLQTQTSTNQEIFKEIKEIMQLFADSIATINNRLDATAARVQLLPTLNQYYCLIYRHRRNSNSLQPNFNYSNRYSTSLHYQTLHLICCALKANH
ncbi:UNVERIFIED_CONTAM: hypothetical protein FKN15_036426 [Acipenser sinensis]